MWRSDKYDTINKNDAIRPEKVAIKSHDIQRLLVGR